MSELLYDTDIASAEVNEDKQHHMLSFKTKDCTVKLYKTTKKIIVQGVGSANLTKALSDYLTTNKDSEDEVIPIHNLGDQRSGASVKTTVKDCSDPTDPLTSKLQDEHSDLYFVKEEIRKIKDDISRILKSGGKINIPSTDATETETLNFKLREENNLLQNQLKIAKDSL